MFQYLGCVGNELGHLSFVHSLSCEVPPIPMGDLLKEQVEEMGPHFRYVGNLQKDNEFSFDLSGALMVTGHAASPYKVVCEQDVIMAVGSRLSGHHVSRFQPRLVWSGPFRQGFHRYVLYIYI